MSRFTALFARGAMLLALAFVAAACGDDDDEILIGAPGQLSILLTDAPGDIRTAVVTIDRVYLQRSADQDDTDSDDRVVLREDDFTTNLIDLANTTAELVKDADVPAGRYHQLRFVISGAFIEVENDDGSTSIFASSPNYPGLPAGAVVTGELQMPSLAQSGLKVKLPNDRLDIRDDTHALLVDFDVSRSFGQQAGNSSRWVMSPVIEATDFEFSGNLTASVTRDTTVVLPTINGTPVTLGDFVAVMRTGAGSEERLPLTDPDGNGTFDAQFRFLVPGNYTLDLRAPSDSIVFTTTPARPVTVNVGSGTATQPFVITSARK